MGSLASGDLRESLEALRDLLVERILAAEPKETAPLAKQLADVLVRLNGLPGQEKSALDDLAKRRASRRSPSKRAGGGVVRGQRGG